MKQLKGISVNGQVTIVVLGTSPELFFQKCANEGIIVREVKKLDRETCQGTIRLSDIPKMRRIRRRTLYKVRLQEGSGYPFLWRRFLRKRPMAIGMLFSFFLFLFLSNIIWEVKITGVPKDIEQKIDKQLMSYGVHPGAWLFTMEPPTEIQRKLLNDVPELLWAGVDKKGTTFYLEGVEKVIVEEAKPQSPRNLVASKKGIITSVYVSKGVPAVKVNDYVVPGDLLVSGNVGAASDNDESEENPPGTPKIIAAEGEIKANTWYEVSVSVPLDYNHEELTGNRKKRFYLKAGDFYLPVWGFKDPEYANVHRETKENSIRFFKWDLPLKFNETILSEKTYTTKERTNEEAIQAGIEQAKTQLKQELGTEAKILSEKVLHETIEHGKVNLNLYFSVEENIVREEPIYQGD